MKLFVVKQYVDALDTNPTVSEPVQEWEALDIKADWAQETMDYIVQHSPYMLSEDEYNETFEHELSMIVIEEC